MKKYIIFIIQLIVVQTLILCIHADAIARDRFSLAYKKYQVNEKYKTDSRYESKTEGIVNNELDLKNKETEDKYGLYPKEIEWLKKTEFDYIKADIKKLCNICGECPESFIGSPDFAFFAGFTSGRFTQIDRNLPEQSEEEEKALSAAQDNLYKNIGYYTKFEAAVFSAALGFVSPAAVCGLFPNEIWPKEILNLRPFYIGWFLGQYVEGEKSSVRAMKIDGVKKLLFDIIASHRRPDNGPSLLINLDPNKF